MSSISDPALFWSSRHGNATIIFAASIFVLFGAVGGAIDYGRWLSAKNKIQAALDSAVLAGGRAAQVNSGSPTVAISAAQSYFNELKPATISGDTTTFTLIENNSVIRGETTAQIIAPFLNVLGFPALPIHFVSEAVIANGSNAETSLELALMLDVTGSMSGQKIEDMKVAAKDLVDIVVWSDQSQYTSKVAIAPFAPRVNLGSLAPVVTGMPETTTQSGSSVTLIPCVTEREGPEAFTDAPPAAGAYSRAFMGDNQTSTPGNYSTSAACADLSTDEQIVALTSNKTALKNRIDLLTAGGSTAGQLGAAWAWYLLSPRWQAVWPAPSHPEPYSNITTLNQNGR
ncbi:MAG: pilus assembly protein TadG-related protein, partial [Pirellulaceae bacterium]